MNKSTPCIWAIAVLVIGIAACSDEPAAPPDTSRTAQTIAFANAPPPPPGLVTATFGPASLQLWPFTGTDLAGSDADPMNLLFVGNVDLLSLRAALLSLDGNRTDFGFPAVPPFNCTWTDAFGDVQTAYSAPRGWVANPIQLACGPYDPMRFHVRFFEAGPWVMAGAHFDLHVPGTADHRVISWELPEQLILVDFLRSGLLHPAAPFSAAPINPSPSYRTIDPQLFNAMPDALKALVGLPTGSSAVPVPIPSNGLAIVLNVATRAPLDEGTTTQSFDLSYDQFVPRPFCSSGPADILYVTGLVHFEARVQTDGDGHLQSWQMARGKLTGTPVNPVTGQPTGPSFDANVQEIHDAVITQGAINVGAKVERIALPPAAQSLMTLLRVGNSHATFTRREKC